MKFATGFAIAAFVSSTAWAQSPPADQPTSNNVITSYQATNSDLMNALVGTRAMLAAAQERATDLRKQLDELGHHVAELNKTNEEMKSYVAKLQGNKSPSSGTAAAGMPPVKTDPPAPLPEATKAP